jgi:ubiquinone/menaquinone biosynthesis C-methylase UbiE
VIGRFIARQLGHPSSVIGPLVLAPLWNGRNRALNDMALEALSLSAGDTVLEVGFGGGYLLEQLLRRSTSARVAGIDASGAMTAHCRRRFRSDLRAGRLELQRASAGAIPYEAGAFDKVVSVNSLFYWPDVARGIAECWRVTRAGGALVLVFTSSGSLEGRSFARHGLSLHDGPEMRGMMEGVGFAECGVSKLHDAHRQYWCVKGIKPASAAVR